MTLENKITLLGTFLNSFTDKSKEFLLVQANHFENIRREIDIKRETLFKLIYETEKYDGKVLNQMIESINRESAQMIAKTEIIENSFRNNFVHFKSNLINGTTETLIQKFKDKESPNLVETEYEEKIEEFKNILKNFRLFEIDLFRNKFKPYEIISSFAINLGFLYLFNDFIQYPSAIRNVVVSYLDSNRIDILNLNLNVILKSFIGHKETISYMCLLDENKLLSASLDHKDNIIMWDLESGNLLKKFLNHSEPVTCLKILSDGHFASGSFDQSIKVWNVNENETCVFTLKGHSKRVSCLEWHKEKNILSSGSYDFTVRLWDFSQKKCLKILRGHTSYVTCLREIQKSIEDILLASGSADGFIRIWNILNGDCIKQIKYCHEGWINTLELDACNRLISCGDKSIRVWDSSTYECVLEMNGHFDLVNFFSVNKISGQLVSSSHMCIKIWDMNSNDSKTLGTYHNGIPRYINKIEWIYN
jgi:WD40 repeat protein